MKGKKRRKPLRWFTILGVLLAFLAVSVVVVKSNRTAGLVAGMLESALEAATGESVSVGSVALSFWEGQIAIDGLVVAHRSENPAHDGEPIIAVQGLEITLMWGSDGLGLGSVTVQNPIVSLHWDEDGLREFRSLRGQTTHEGPAEFVWNELWVRDGAVVLESGSNRVEIQGIEISPSDAEAPGATAWISLESIALEIDGIPKQTAKAVQMSGVGVAPDRFSIPHLEMMFNDFLISGSMAAHLGGPLRGNLTLGSDLATLDHWFDTPRSLNGEVDVDIALGGTTKVPQIEGTLWGRNLSMVRGTRTFVLPKVTGAWTLDGRTVAFAPLVAEWASGSVEFQGSIDPKSMVFQASLFAEELGFAEAMRQLDVSNDAWVNCGVDLEAHVGGTLSPFVGAGSLKLVTHDFASATGPVSQNEPVLALPWVSLEGGVQFDAKHLAIDAHQVQAPRIDGWAQVWLGFGGQGPLDVKFGFSRLSLDQLKPVGGLDLEGRVRGRGRLSGPYSQLKLDSQLTGVDVVLSGVEIGETLKTRLWADNLRVLHFDSLESEFGETTANGAVVVAFEEEILLDMKLATKEGKIADLVGLAVDVPGLSGSANGSVELKGPYDALSGTAKFSLVDTQLVNERFDDGLLTAWMDDGRITIEEFSLRRSGGFESLLARGNIAANGDLNIDVASGGLRLESLDNVGVHSLPLRGKWALDARIQGTLTRPEPHGRLVARETWFAGGPVEDTMLFFDTDDGVLEFEGGVAGKGLGVAGAVDLWSDGAYAIHADLDSFPLHILYPQASDDQPIRAGMSGQLDIAGSWMTVPDDAPGMQTLFQLNADDVWLTWGGHTYRSDTDWIVAMADKEWNFDGISLRDEHSWFRFSGVRSADGTLAGEGGGQLELDILRAFVSEIERAEGVAAVNLSVVGQGRNVEPMLDISVDEGLLQGSWFPEPVAIQNASVIVTPTEYRIGQAQGRVGGGTWTAQGTIEAESWSPTRYNLNGALRSVRIKYFDFLPHMVGDADLVFDGPADQLMLSGHVELEEMVFDERIDWEGWLLEVSDEHLEYAVGEVSNSLFFMEIDIEADQGVRVRNNVADLTASGSLAVTGNTAKPGLTGTIRVDPEGRVYIKERDFELSRGEIRFVDAYSFDPEIDFAMETEIRTRDETYDVEYRVYGPYSDWRAETSSNPSLPQADVNALLVFGMTRAELERYGGLGGALAVEGGDLLASKFGLVERVGTGIFQLDFLDRIDLVSGASDRGSGAISSELKLLAEKDLGWDTTLIVEQNLIRQGVMDVTLEKKLARSLSLRSDSGAPLGFATGPAVYSRAYFASEQEGRYLPVGGAYGLEFRLRWEFESALLSGW